MSSLGKQEAKKRGRKPKDQGAGPSKGDPKKNQKIEEDSEEEEDDMSYGE